MGTSNIKSLTKEEAMVIQLLRRISDDYEQQRLIWKMEGWLWGIKEQEREKALINRPASNKIINFPNG